jgi:hypothetical protein
MKSIKGHLTANEKKAIKAILDAGLLHATVGRKTYLIAKEGHEYTAKITVKDRGLIPCPGSQLRISTYNHRFVL